MNRGALNWLLVWRGLVRRPRSAAASILLAGVAVFLLLAAFAAPRFLNSQSSTDAHRWPILWSPETSEGVAPSDLMVRGASSYVGSEPIYIVHVAVTGDSNPLPPGVLDLPAAGEVVASPRVAQALRSNPATGIDTAIGSLVPGRLVGVIEDAGLANPTELAAYIGVDASTPRLRPLSGRGWGDWQDVPASDAAPTELTLVVASLALPTMAFMILTMQVGERRARRRSSVLASLDMASVTGRSVAVTESLVVGVLGCVSGMLAYHGFVHHLGGGSILPWAWWPRSGAVSMTERAIACLLVLGPLSLWPFVQAKSAAPVHTTRSALVRSIVRLIPLAAVLALSLFRTDLIDSDVKLFGFLGGASIAILLAATPLPIVLGATIERFVRGPLGLLVDGRIRTSTRTITWLGASVVCGTFIAIVSLVLMHDRSETLGAEAERAAAGWPSSTAIAEGHMSSSDLSTLESLGAERVLPVRIMQGTTTSTQASISVGIIDCGALGNYV
ncbi:MAG: hypothetical protein GY698_06775, partial [Actinomycetia bacterium]|nr:hypothetical protein [Actinomycetes bacterium]